MSRGQDELARRRRLNAGCCPTHGIPLSQIGTAHNDAGIAVGPFVACPRGDCDFSAAATPGTKLYAGLQR